MCIARVCTATAAAPFAVSFGAQLKTHMARSDIHWLGRGGGGRKRKRDEEEVVEKEGRRRERERVF